MKLAVTAILLLSLNLTFADRTIWYVHPDSTLNSIQAALDSCVDNDIVLVGPGTYNEYIVWPQIQGIHLLSELGADSTVIDAYGLYVNDVIFIDSSVDTTTVISGFTITHACYGITLHYSSPVIEHNRICDNEHGSIVLADAAGVLCYYSHPSIINNEILHNGAAGEIGTCGGVYCISSSPIIYNNTIVDNYSIGGITGNGSGGGIYCQGTSSPLILENLITDNFAESGGGILTGTDCTSIIRGNVITSNTGQYRGGGILCLGTSQIDSNAISGNQGVGVVCATNANPIINYNNIIQNTDYAVYNQNTYFINAEYNWWGDLTGPYHPDSNPGGLGDTVSDYVDFIPWLDGPVGVWEKPVVNNVNKHTTIGSTIFCGPLQLPEGKQCKVFDIMGRVVMSDKIKPGVYFIEIDGKITRKVVKVR